MEGIGNPKRPKALYFVVAWCCIALLFQSSALTRPLRTYTASGQYPPPLLALLPVALFAFIIWQGVRLARLKSFNRWFAVVFFVFWTMTLTWNGVLAFQRHTANPARLVVVFSVIGAFNLASAWYLSRPSFRDFANRRVFESMTSEGV